MIHNHAVKLCQQFAVQLMCFCFRTGFLLVVTIWGLNYLERPISNRFLHFLNEWIRHFELFSHILDGNIRVSLLISLRNTLFAGVWSFRSAYLISWILVSDRASQPIPEVFQNATYSQTRDFESFCCGMMRHRRIFHSRTCCYFDSIIRTMLLWQQTGYLKLVALWK